jgi:putative pyruvate formate lyase activating enzyme
MPDMKYGDSGVAHRYSKVRDYVTANRQAVKEMHRQVGDLVVDDHRIARRGLLVRHLVLPNDLAGTQAVLAFLADEVSPETYVNLMDQYRPCYRADEYPELDRPITRDEYEAVLALARRHGITRLDRREGRSPYAL